MEGNTIGAVSAESNHRSSVNRALEWDASSNCPVKEPCFFKDVSIQHGRQSETIQNESTAGRILHYA
ncbi:hypothetical protein KIN20_030934 [Parelaphostrongylus tenuis]|uniref:Uncharacterized protein n=1 Tax=Parelaphostrongylus tenuis TaxID=148309 RepID=A0AAD5R639_PARTN|nr:hypothetical protein KIN20_030934 [Parelaphostrongylus tenuis]